MPALLAFALKYLADPKVLAGIAFAAVLAFAGLQSARLSHAKHDLATARAALIDPDTKQSWQAEEKLAALDLVTARQNVTAESAAMANQQAAVQAVEATSATDTAAAQKAALAASTGAGAAKAAAAKVLASKEPASNGCAAADALILESLK